MIDFMFNFAFCERFRNASSLLRLSFGTKGFFICYGKY